MLKATLVIILFLNLPCFAQRITGDLEGHISNENGEPVVAANIVLTSQTLQGARGGTSDEFGNFRVLALPSGSYLVKISHIGYGDMVIQDVLIRLARTTSLGKVTLAERTMEMSEVVVTAKPIPIDATTTVVGTNMTRDTVEELPVERNFRAISILSPQADESYLGDEINIAGATGLENLYFIDGVNTTDPAVGLTSTQLPYNFIKEVEIKSGGYEPEFRSALGGIVNVITHSGGNEFSGQAFGFFTNENLRGNPRLGFLETDVASFVKQDAGFSLGGPVVRDKLWFFSAYNLVRDKKDIEISDFGFHEDRKTRHIFAGKLTWKVAEQTDMILSIFGDPSTHNRVGTAGSNPPRAIGNLDAALASLEDGGVNVSLTGRSKIRKNVFLDLMLSRYMYKDVSLPRSELGRNEPQIRDRLNSIWSGGYGRFFDNRITRNAGKFVSSVFLDKHFLKGGFEIEENIFEIDDRVNIVNKNAENLYITNSQAFDIKVRQVVPSFFIQDSWSSTSRLRFNIGLRWDGQYIYGSDGEVAQSILDQYQPRIGITYQPGELGSQTIFGSVGRFYEQIPPLFLGRSFFSESTRISARFAHNPVENPAGGDTTIISSGITSAVKGLDGQFYDEIIIGYERVLGNQLKFSISGIYRNLGEVVEDIIDSNNQFRIGNPGQDALSAFPRFTRKYTALRITLEKTNSRPFDFLLSYVLSRNHGNYAGLFNPERGFYAPHTTRSLDLLEQIENSTGLLPNDRTHVLKFNSSYRLDSGLSLGTSFIWQTGTPLTDFGGTSIGNPWFIFLSERGSAGRSPSIWNLSFRLSYDLGKAFKSSFRQKLILDVFHLFSQRKAVRIEQRHFFGVDDDGNQIGENTNYLRPISFQPPLTIRLGLEVGF